MELQGGQVRLVLSGSERDAEADVHDTYERLAARQTNYRRADESVSDHQRFDHGRIVEFLGEEKNQAVQASAAGRARRHLADGAERHRSCPGIPEMHRMFSLP